MPSPWLSLPQWNTNAENSRQHPAPAPSSMYSPTATHRSSAQRPFSGFFNRFTTPRLGARPAEAPDVPPVQVNIPSPMTPWAGAQRNQHNGDLYEAGSGRPIGPGSVVSDMRANAPQPLFGARTAQGGLQPPTPAHPTATNAGGDLPITFSPSDIGYSSPRPPPQAEAEASRPRRQRRHRHRRHRAAQHIHHPSTSTIASMQKSSGPYKPKPALRDPAIKVKLLHTLVSGSLFLLTLIVFLALNPQTPVFSPPFRIVNALLIVFFAIIFVHSLVRLQVMILAHRRKQRRTGRKIKDYLDSQHADGGSMDFGHVRAEDSTAATGGVPPARPTRRVQYFDDPEIGLPPPGEPIRVVLARDEDIGVNDDLVAEDVTPVAGNTHAADLARHERGPITSPAVADAASGPSANRVQGTPKPPPPVYGVWRGSVRADPNLLHWQRVERPGFGGESVVESADEDEELFGAHSRPPPSYVTQEMRGQQHGGGSGSGSGNGGLETLPATRYVI